jgi:hypothetical protein
VRNKKKGRRKFCDERDVKRGPATVVSFLQRVILWAEPLRSKFVRPKPSEMLFPVRNRSACSTPHRDDRKIQTANQIRSAHFKNTNLPPPKKKYRPRTKSVLQQVASSAAPCGQTFTVPRYRITSYLPSRTSALWTIMACSARPFPGGDAIATAQSAVCYVPARGVAVACP